MVLDARLLWRLPMKFDVEHRFPAFVDRPIELHNIISKIWKNLAQSPANMGFYRQSIDLRHALVDANEAVVHVHQNKADCGTLRGSARGTCFRGFLPIREAIAFSAAMRMGALSPTTRQSNDDHALKQRKKRSGT